MEHSVIRKQLLTQLRQLQAPEGYYNAGIPNYEHLFGRDSCISALQVLHLDEKPARATLEVLAEFAGKRRALWWEEYKGKILHEHYPGGLPQQLHDLVSQGDRLRQLGAILFWRFPYYGSVDAGAWYIILLHHYLEKTHDAEFASQKLPTAKGIAEWLHAHANHTRTQLVGFKRHYIFGLRNQSWKDNLTEAIVPPVAMVEVQGYYYFALRLLADTIQKYQPDHGYETELRDRAEVIKQEFRQYFKIEDGILPMAVDGRGQPVKMVVSNPGQLLFTGILDKSEQDEIVARLMQPDIMTDYGIRTEGAKEQTFQLNGYQNGSVWPFDNWIIHQGMKKCGFNREASIIKQGMIKAFNELNSLPEAYCVNEYGQIGTVKQACKIQAWSAGALLNLLDDAPLL